jgi:hypothetical protein
MRSLGRLAVPIALVGLLATGCTGGDGSTVASGSTPASTSASQSSGPVTITPGHFRYSNAGLTVTLELKESTGTMEVDNGSGHDLGKPRLVIVDGVTTKQWDDRIAGAEPIPDGQQATFQIQLPAGVTAKSLGLINLIFGSDNYGAFAPA